MVEERLAVARVAALFGVAKTAYATTIAAGAMLVAILWNSFPSAVLMAWFGLLAALTFARILFQLSYERGSARREPRIWEARFATGAFAAGALWTVPLALFFPAGDPLLQMAVIFVVGGTVLGAAGIYAASRAAFYGFCGLPILGAVFQLANQPGRTYTLLSLLALIFGAALIRVFLDIHGRLVANFRMRTENEEHLVQERLVLDTLPVGVAFLAERVIVRCNRRLEQMLGYAPGELNGKPARILYHSERAWRAAGDGYQALRDGKQLDGELELARKDGSRIWCSLRTRALDAEKPERSAIVAISDISERHAAAAAQYENVEKLRLAMDAAELEYWEWDQATGSMHFGRAPVTPRPAAKRISFDSWLLRVHEDDRERLRAAALAMQQRGEPYQGDIRIRFPSGEVRWRHARGKAIVDAGGEIARVIGVSQDITERKRQEEEVRFLAYHDTLTGLPNRRLLDDRLSQAVFLAQRRDARVAVMVIDLDRFKQVNDALGHRAGDAVLREAAQRIAGCVRKADTLARHGGDEFVVVIPDLRQDSECQVVAEKILRALQPVFLVDGREFSIGASIGVALYPTDAGDGEGVLRNADAAMYRAKQLGSNNYRFYNR